MNRLFIMLLVIAGVFMACAAKKNIINGTDELSGTWQLDYVSGPRITFEGLYPNKKPFLKIEVDSNRVSGNTSCNNFFGKLDRDGQNISFKEGLGMTKMACPGEGESVFLRTLEKIDRYDITDDGNTLNLIMGDIALMRFKRQE
ncbi:META domain-containing protein [Olivibacter sp. SDN3]|uniref:META domain-containing protein n=1 Tax=Olivibacter sp. SDN3 TaxID=2764720 RepID=UPI0016513D59|nr:META domain-containing protein [Olivibacter sp. SDN3]QNL47747.1 META domain-containing protein [Olivibacter sp. SDN3]